MLIPAINASGISKAVLIAHMEAISSASGVLPLLFALYSSIIDRVTSVEPNDAPISILPTLAAVVPASAVPLKIPPVAIVPAATKPICTADSDSVLSN